MKRIKQVSMKIQDRILHRTRRTLTLNLFYNIKTLKSLNEGTLSWKYGKEIFRENLLY